MLEEWNFHKAPRKDFKNPSTGRPCPTVFRRVGHGENCVQKALPELFSWTREVPPAQLPMPLDTN